MFYNMRNTYVLTQRATCTACAARAPIAELESDDKKRNSQP